MENAKKATRKEWIKRLAALSLALLMMAGSFTLLATKADAAVTKYSYNSDSPFFNEYMNNVYSLDNESSLDVWYDQFPISTNTSNFSSLGTSTYANINGHTVTVDAFNRDPGDSIDDPNFGQGILIYQCIQYKVKHPDAEMFLYFSSYRTSITASV